MDFVAISTDPYTGLFIFTLTSHALSGPLDSELKGVLSIFGTYENATIFFATPDVATWKTYCLSMIHKEMLSPDRAKISTAACVSVEERFHNSPSSEATMNYIRARLLSNVLRAYPSTLLMDPKTSSSTSFQLMGLDRPSDVLHNAYNIESKADLIKDFEILGVAIEEQVRTGVSDKVYDEQLLNRIIDNPFIEKDLQKIWYARPKKELPDASDIRLLEQICLETAFRKILKKPFN